MQLHRATFALVALAALSAGTAFASDQGGSSTAAPAEEAEPSDKKAEPMLCRKLAISGSRMPKRICATKAEWDDHTKRAAQSLEEGQQESDRRSLNIPDSRGN